jgi:hypothetical protein
VSAHQQAQAELQHNQQHAQLFSSSATGATYQVVRRQLLHQGTTRYQGKPEAGIPRAEKRTPEAVLRRRTALLLPAQWSTQQNHQPNISVQHRRSSPRLSSLWYSTHSNSKKHPWRRRLWHKRRWSKSWSNPLCTPHNLPSSTPSESQAAPPPSSAGAPAESAEPEAPAAPSTDVVPPHAADKQGHQQRKQQRKQQQQQRQQ